MLQINKTKAILEFLIIRMIPAMRTCYGFTDRIFSSVILLFLSAYKTEEDTAKETFVILVSNLCH